MTDGLYSVASLRRIEQDAAVGLAPGTLMQRAGAAAARIIDARLAQRRARVRVLCGPGNNGGDGYVTALRLQELGHQVTCVQLAPPATDDARAAAAAWTNASGACLTHLPTDTDCDAVIDAMFGIGLTRPLAGPFADAVAWLSRQRLPLFALDVPSGLDADTGAWVGGVPGVLATATITFIGAKPGLFTADGCDASRDIEVAPLDLALPPPDGRLNTPQAFAAVSAPRRRNTHKGRFGNLVVTGGAPGMVGAALLAARAGLRLGAGRVYVDCLDEAAPRVDVAQPELMFRPAAEVAEIAAHVMGCGLGVSAKAAAALGLALAQTETVPVVLDADALNLIADTPALRTLAESDHGVRVLTPHPLEAARLLATTVAKVQADRVAAALALAKTFKAIVVLKGAGSIIASADGGFWINTTGGPALATAGTGDVLAGMIGALIAQGFEPVQAVLAAVWLHGRAADDSGADIGLVAGDVAAGAARALAGLRVVQ